MNKRLVTDPFVRRLAQFILIGGLFAIFLLQVAFLILLASRRLELIDEVSSWNQLPLTILKFPFDTDFASFSAIIVGVIPIAISAVCYKICKNEPTETLNRTGHISVFLLVSGTMIGLVAIATAGLLKSDFDAMIGGNDTVRIAIRNTLSAVLGFQTFYALQLLGMKK